MSEPEQLHPESGARFLFELGERDDEAAHYRITVFLPSLERHEGGGRAALGTEQVIVEGLADAPEWVRTFAQRFLRQIAAGQRKRSQPRWPRRVLRWRER